MNDSASLEVNSWNFSNRIKFVILHSIYDIVKKVIDISKRDNIPTEVASKKIADERINAVSNAKRIRIYRDIKLFKQRNL